MDVKTMFETATQLATDSRQTDARFDSIVYSEAAKTQVAIISHEAGILAVVADTHPSNTGYTPVEVPEDAIIDYDELRCLTAYGHVVMSVQKRQRGKKHSLTLDGKKAVDLDLSAAKQNKIRSC